VGYIYDSYAELGKLCMRNQEELVNYIDRIQTVYNQIIEAERSLGEPLTDVEITKINKRFTHAFYCGLSSDIGTIVEKRNDLSPSEMYEMAETANQELKARREPRQAYTSSRRFPANPLLPQPALKGVNGKIKETITDKIRANNVMMYFANQVVGVVNRQK